MPLTDVECRNARCPDGRPRLRLADAGGLYLEVSPPSARNPAGSKLWRWKYRFAGKEKLLALGAYPAVPLASRRDPDTPGGIVKGARHLRDEARALLAAGTDPSEARRDAKHAILTAHETAFEPVARMWWAAWKANKTGPYVEHVMRRLEADVFPVIGRKPVAALTASHFVTMAKKVEARGAAELARRSLQTCGLVMRYAVAHDLAERNPVADVKPADVLAPRTPGNFARIGAAELPELMRKLAGYQGTPLTRAALALLPLTAVRTSELILARWQEFDTAAGEWTIPPDRIGRKGAAGKRRPHVVPLSKQALEVLGTLQAVRGADRCTGSALLFPGERDHDRPMSNNTILKALERLGYAGRMTGHGFRGLFSTWANESGYRPDVIEAQLSHAERDKTRAAYNSARYMDERRELMQAWADYLAAVRQSGKAIPFRQTRAGRKAA